MYRPYVYVPLNLKDNTSAKLYKFSRIKQRSVISLVEEIIERYIDAWSFGKIDCLGIEEIKEENIRKKIGMKIAYLRQLNCFSQKRFGEIVNLDQQSMSQIELGKRRLDIVEAIAIAQVLGVELSEII